MFFKKILPQLDENLHANEIVEPNDLQKLIIPKIKGGQNINVLADKGSGKTTIALTMVINKLKHPQGDNPRALIFVKDKVSALELEQLFNKLAHKTELRAYPVFEEQQLDKQKDAIYLGVDVVIGTPERLAKLYYLNGLNLRELQMFIVEDADFLKTSALHSEIIRISESINKCQYLILSGQTNNRIDRIKASINEKGYRIEDVKK